MHAQQRVLLDMKHKTGWWISSRAEGWLDVTGHDTCILSHLLCPTTLPTPLVLEGTAL